MDVSDEDLKKMEEGFKIAETLCDVFPGVVSALEALLAEAKHQGLDDAPSVIAAEAVIARLDVAFPEAVVQPPTY